MKTSTNWFVYMLLCADSSLYTGIALDPKKRFEEHRKGEGGAYTRSHTPLRIVYTEKLPSKSSALRRELHIKKMPRSEKMKL